MVSWGQWLTSSYTWSLTQWLPQRVETLTWPLTRWIMLFIPSVKHTDWHSNAHWKRTADSLPTWTYLDPPAEFHAYQESLYLFPNLFMSSVPYYCLTVLFNWILYKWISRNFNRDLFFFSSVKYKLNDWTRVYRGVLLILL